MNGSSRALARRRQRRPSSGESGESWLEVRWASPLLGAWYGTPFQVATTSIALAARVREWGHSRVMILN